MLIRNQVEAPNYCQAILPPPGADDARLLFLPVMPALTLLQLLLLLLFSTANRFAQPPLRLRHSAAPTTTTTTPSQNVDT